MGSLVYHWCIKSLYTMFKYTLFFVRSWRNSVSGYVEPGYSSNPPKLSSRVNLCSVLSKEPARTITSRNNLFWEMLYADGPSRHAFGAGVTTHADNATCFRS